MGTEGVCLVSREGHMFSKMLRAERQSGNAYGGRSGSASASEEEIPREKGKPKVFFFQVLIFFVVGHWSMENTAFFSPGGDLGWRVGRDQRR
jgi:hypothetical protein